jgi:NAD(P)H-hydrate repair Nnr-like enzyme with NAD(P)H-hydrate dehydratase domain
LIQPVAQEKLLFPEILWSLPQYAHARKRGKVFVIAGGLGSGVPTVEAAQKTGVGLVKLGIPESAVASGKKFLPEDLAVPLPESREGTISLKSEDMIVENSKSADVTVVGGGTTRNPETLQLVSKVIPEIESALILWGDALNAVNASDISKRKFPTVIVADSGELGRILISSGYKKHGNRTIVEHIYQHKFDVLSEASAVANAVIILHGPDTAVVSKNKVILEKTGLQKPAEFMGILAGILAQNKSKVFEASATALHVFGKAKERSNLVGYPDSVL